MNKIKLVNLFLSNFNLKFGISSPFQFNFFDLIIDAVFEEVKLVLFFYFL